MILNGRGWVSRGKDLIFYLFFFFFWGGGANVESKRKTNKQSSPHFLAERHGDTKGTGEGAVSPCPSPVASSA